MIQRLPIGNSTTGNVLSAGYDTTSQVLEIEFRGGVVYQCLDVPASEYVSLVSAPSAGSYYHAYIKNSYRVVRL